MTFEIFIFKFPDTKIYPFWCAVLRVGKFIVINHHCNPDKELCYHPLKMPTFPGTASSVVRSHRVINPWSILCSYSFAFSRTSYKWSHENAAFWGAHLAECTGVSAAAACSGSLPLSATEHSVVRVGQFVYAFCSRSTFRLFLGFGSLDSTFICWFVWTQVFISLR